MHTAAATSLSLPCKGSATEDDSNSRRLFMIQYLLGVISIITGSTDQLKLYIYLVTVIILICCMVNEHKVLQGTTHLSGASFHCCLSYRRSALFAKSSAVLQGVPAQMKAVRRL